MTVTPFKSESQLWLLYQWAYDGWCANPCDETTKAKDAAAAKWQRAFLIVAAAQKGSIRASLSC